MLGASVLLAIATLPSGGQEVRKPQGAAVAPRPTAQRSPMGRLGRPGNSDQARALQQDLRALADAVMGPEDRPTPVDPIDVILARLGRPARSVRTPQLEPEAIDEWLESHGSSDAAGSSEPAGETEFLRRVSLDLTGLLPSPEAIAEFSRDADPAKRAKLIDQLLGSPEYAINWSRYWRDVIAFHATTENPLAVRFPTFESWLAEQLAANRPWDQIVEAMLTSTGRSDTDGATALISAHSTNQRFQPAEMAGEASRIFLGIPIACAQCHDHPTDPWKRQQFHEFAAFFAGTRTQLERETRPPVRLVSDQTGPPRYRMPGLNDPNTSIPVEARFFLAEQPLSPGATSRLSAGELRSLAASYITGQDNPWFARAYVNRLWSVLIGEAFYEPIDDLGPTRKPRDGALLDRIADEWAQGGYNVRWLFRTLMNTRTYQRATRPARGTGEGTSVCTGRLRADQIFDALVRALELPTEAPLRAIREVMGAMGQQGNVAASLAPGRFSPRTMFNVVFGVDPSTPSDEVTGTIPQALLLMNGPQIDQAVQARPGRMLGRLLAETPDDDAAVASLYLRVLARAPNQDERAACRAYLARVRPRAEAFEDLLWALLNSTEFLSRR
jgi:hypothetical protein